MSDYYGFLLKTGGLSDEELRIAVYYRYTAAQRMHPMSGGVDRLRVDSAADYAALRRTVYDIDLAPLPDSLWLSAQDEALNRRADWRVQAPHGTCDINIAATASMSAPIHYCYSQTNRVAIP